MFIVFAEFSVSVVFLVFGEVSVLGSACMLCSPHVHVYSSACQHALFSCWFVTESSSARLLSSLCLPSSVCLL